MTQRLHFRRRPGLARSVSGLAVVALLLVASAFIAHQHADPTLAGENGQQCQLCLQVGTPTPTAAADLAPRVAPPGARAVPSQDAPPVAQHIAWAYLSRGPPFA